MKTCFAYVRVSTTRQGEEGVSLQEQRRAILEYASRRSITITEWFEEQISAAKRGRPIFNRMVGLLKSKKSAGIIIHKIDRGARNLRDWADMAELMDRGIEVHFAHESIDLHTRSGRLSADILAVVAADYIRNLREEVIKGINGRLKQGLFPFSAPIGYLNNGSGKVKTIDPVRGPLVRLAFEFYSSRQYSLRRLEGELFVRGLRTGKGKVVRLSHLSTLLRNPFYMGLLRLANRKDTFPGIHEPLIGSALFNQVQLILDGKRTTFRHHNQLLLRLMIRCEHCRLCVNGERQKGHVYYRCSRKTCPKTCIREERFEEAIIEALKRINITPEEEPILADMMKELRKRESEISLNLRRSLEEELAHVRESIKILLQKFLDNSISKEIFDEGYGELLMQRSVCEEKLQKLDAEQGMYDRVNGFLTQLRSLCERFCTDTLENKRKLLNETFQAITTSGSIIRLTLTSLMQHTADREKTKEGWDRLLPIIARELVGR